MSSSTQQLKSIYSILLFIALLISSNVSAAEAVQDPMQPPAFALKQFRLAKLKQQRGGAGAVKKTDARKPLRKPFQLSSILIGKARKVAIINGRMLVIGDKIENAKVIKITKDRVKLLRNGKTINLKLESDLISIRKNSVKSNL